MEPDIELTEFEKELLEWFITAGDGMVHVEWSAQSMYLPKAVFTVGRAVLPEYLPIYEDCETLSYIPPRRLVCLHEGDLRYYDALMRLQARGYVGSIANEHTLWDNFLPDPTGFSELPDTYFTFRNVAAYVLSHPGLKYIRGHIPAFFHLIQFHDDVDDLPW